MPVPDERPDRSTPIGAAVHADFRKYDGREHWQEPYRLLGVDEHGVWLGMAAGTSFGRPGRDMTAPSDGVRLIPHAGEWAAIFNAPASGVRIHTYVDITDTPTWRRVGEGFRVTLIDLDLDVVRPFEGEAFIDDEDEFEEHQRQFGYPAELVSATRSTADAVLRLVSAGAAPFDQVGQEWLAKVGG